MVLTRISMSWWPVAAFTLAMALTTGPIPASGAAAKKASGKSKKMEASDSLFASKDVPRFEIEVSDAALATLRKYEWSFKPQTERESVQVTIREGQTTYTNVALHCKGAAGSFRSVDQKPALTLHFDRFAPGQRFHGLSKLSLNNSVQDPTFVTEQLCRELFLKANVPVPRATHATVRLNGRDLGLYVLTEGWDKQFLKRHFQKTGGNLYDGGFLKDVTDELTTNAGDNPKNQADRITLAEAAKEPDLAKRVTRLQKVLDIDRFLTFVALDVMLWDWDGYAQNRNNWRLYHDLDKDRMVFMPHGMDQMFWKPEGSILPAMRGLVARAVLDVPEWRERYFERMKELRASVFNPEQMTNRARAISATFEATLKAKDEADASEQHRALEDLCNAIVRRAKSLDDQLAHPIKPLEFDTAGLAHVPDWEQKADFGTPELVKSTSPGQPAALVIATAKGSSIGSWRAKVWLQKGKYRLESRLKTEAITADPGDPRGGAGLRLTRDRPDKYTLGTSDWHEVGYDFLVNDPLAEVQLACEFRGAEGKALFDLSSLRLRQIKNDKSDAPGRTGRQE
jgi:spore coat protein H